MGVKQEKPPGRGPREKLTYTKRQKWKRCLLRQVVTKEKCYREKRERKHTVPSARCLKSRWAEAVDAGTARVSARARGSATSVVVTINGPQPGKPPRIRRACARPALYIPGRVQHFISHNKNKNKGGKEGGEGGVLCIRKSYIYERGDALSSKTIRR